MKLLLLCLFVFLLHAVAGYPLPGHGHYNYHERRQIVDNTPFRLKVHTKQLPALNDRYVVPFMQPNGAKYALAFPSASGHYTLDSAAGVLYYHDHQYPERSVVSVGRQERIGDVSVLNTKPISNQEQQTLHRDAFDFNTQSFLTHKGASHWYACELTMAINYPFPLIAFFDHKPEEGCKKVELQLSFL
ncbi:hypothetical protein TRICI_003464 [Trichomonascus ciferrii]|uniref:Protein ROT1 n=1 Tax=Trichomonascus ciferrii TaxID=44093 RepID=A0A642V3Q6_9ASCO|nr:hypothetical protein TRICI_003464 [Trichomonascus ciferrii]